mgnify:CR=1 FL=1
MDTLGWNWQHTYAQLPRHFFSRTRPTPVRAPELVLWNAPLATSLGLPVEGVPPATLAAWFAGNVVPEGAQPLAQAYAGHQFGHFTMLGDGRAILLGEIDTPQGRRVDLQLKGAGPTPFSRGGDGRAALGPMLREYIISEAMHALGIPTTRSLAVVRTGQPVYRENPLPGAVLTRVAASNIRVGTFEYLRGQGDLAGLRQLADYTIARHYPGVEGNERPYLAFLEQVCERQARLIAQWMLVGFVHGVMNTDNMSLAGETIDYGPCAFLEHYDPTTVFSSIDRGGRYSYSNQPGIALWNLTRLAEALLPLLHDDTDTAVREATEVLERFPLRYGEAWLAGMRSKLGLRHTEPADQELAEALLGWMESSRADFTNTFRSLKANPNHRSPATPTTDPRCGGADFEAWYQRWQARLEREQRPRGEIQAEMDSANPAVIPRNHRVEEALAAAQQDDLHPVTELLEALRDPYTERPEHARFREPSTDPRPYRTFCGT